MNKNKSQNKNQPVKRPLKINIKKKDLFDFFEGFFERNKTICFLTTVFLSLLFGISLFNIKISEGNDDALYIEAGLKFSKDFFGFYTSYAPLYPMVLSLFVKFFGVNVILLKGLSMVFMVLGLFFTFKAFEKRVPYLVLFTILIIASINSYFLFFASMTFTEQFFLMLQGIFIFMFFRAFDKTNEKYNIINGIKLWLPVSLILFILSLSRNVSVGIIFPIIVYFLFEKKIIHSVFVLAGFAIFRIPFELFRKLMWGGQNQFSNQVSVLLLQKDPYDLSKGKEDFSGLIDRFTGNYGLYISKRFYQILGFLTEKDAMVRPGLGFIFFVLIVFSAIFILRKREKILSFIFLYTTAMVCLTFVALQTRWDQFRFILVFVPLILIVFLSSLYYAFKPKGNFVQFLFLIFVIILTGSSFIGSVNKSVANYPILKHNISGDLFYGYTEDWQNYLKMSKWCGDSLPVESLVACRKAPMSFVYAGGKEFFPVYTAFSTDPDTVLATFKREKVTHIILASLRRNPSSNDGTVINTIHRILQPVIQKYPTKLALVKQIGTSEPAYLYKINY